MSDKPNAPSLPDSYTSPPDPCNRKMRAECDGEGWVTRMLDARESTTDDFRGVLKATRRQVDPADVDLHGWPVDHEGRGLTVLEVEQQRQQERVA